MTAASANGAETSIGTSLSECTARSARRSSSATSSSLTKSPLPPISLSARSSTRSPSVVMPRIPTSQAGYSARRRACTCSACHIASWLWREAITSRAGAAGVVRAPVTALADQVLDRRPLPPADRQPLVDVAQHHLPVRIATVGLALRHHPLEARDRRTRDQRVAVNPHETIAELLLERSQRLLDQELALAGAHRDVLELGLQVDDLLERHQEHAAALVHRQVPAPRVGRACQLVDRLRVLLRHARQRTLQRLLQAFGAHRLEQIVDRPHLERIDRELVERGDEDDQRHR